MHTDELREAYLEFFASKGCVRRPSDVLVPRGDPTVLFTPAGMNQFKEQFLGIGPLEFTRATTCQKCLRTGDIENVGKTAFHETFFEMLGNFSFGDYFKREAIHWAWEFLRKVLELPAERLTVSVYQDDDEAYAIWNREIGLAAGRIARLGEEDNFWPAAAPSKGPNGVCGPCSEIFYQTPDGRQVEIWNLVFTQFNRVGPHQLEPLPKKNIDTGMGLERTAACLQNVSTVFETDIFRPLVAAVAEIRGKAYQADDPEGVRVRRIADHARAVTFCILENVRPEPKKQGAVLRLLLRRAGLDAYMLGVRAPFLYRLVPLVGEVMKAPYPEVLENARRIADVVRQEETQFLNTIDHGIRSFEDAVRKCQAGGQDTLSGEDAFKLHATHGFPIEMTEALAAERNLRVDRARFDVLFDEFRKTSGQGAFSGSVFDLGPLDSLKGEMKGTEFLGYETRETRDATVRGIIAEGLLVDSLTEVGHGEPVTLVLDRSPFYGEAGGQIGDTGWIESKTFRFRVEDTQRDGDFLLHVGHLQEGEIHTGARVSARVDRERLDAIRRAHSATHLLHHALHTVLGPHAQQAGSKVEPDRLRFDFSHPQALSRAELLQIEDLVNRRIMEAARVRWRRMPIAEARKVGAMALFGEKYGDVVRVVEMGDFSREFCGGIHLDNTGQVGLCKIVAEESVASGTRRIVALTGPAALEYTRRQEALLREVAETLKAAPAEAARRAAALAEEVRDLKKQLAQRRQESAGSWVDETLQAATLKDGVKIVARDVPEAKADDLRARIDQLRRKAGGPLAVLLAGRDGDKVQLVGGLSRDLVERGLKAGDWIKAVAPLIGGGGGGRPDMAQAGGSDASQVPAALAAGVQYLETQLRG